tara:strand:- start:185 stop:640 length:456 start_codon:yes stop_codon:yes gene_type:complete
MYEQFLKADGRRGSVGDKGSLEKVFARFVEEASTPATYDDDGNELTAKIIPDEADVVVPITDEEVKTHPWHLPVAREARLRAIRGLRDHKLSQLDLEYQRADEGSHPQGKTKAQVGTEKQALRDLPPIAETDLDDITNTDDIEAYLPTELE